MGKDSVSFVIPVFNEAATLEAVVSELFDSISDFVDPVFILSEDGSTDDTKSVIRSLMGRFPVTAILSEQRKGYAYGVLDGIDKVETEYVFFNDSDGQIDPNDIRKLWEARELADVIVGDRVNRADSKMRVYLSAAFHKFYRLLFGVRLNDPSSPLLLVKTDKAKLIGFHSRSLGKRLVEGFWWEFNAWAWKLGYSHVEYPIRHRLRLDGKGTNVYHPRKLFFILIRNILNLLRVKFTRVTPRN